MRKFGIPLTLTAIAALTIGLALLLTFRTPASPVLEGPPQKIRIANIGIYSNYNIIADRMGFFRKHGLDAEVVEYDSGATSMDALESGEADVAVAASFVGVRRIFADGDLKILATVSSHDVFRVLARRDKGITWPADIKGKRVGVTLKTAGEFYLGKFLTTNGLRFEDVQVVDLSASDIADGIQDGTLDVGVVFDPNTYRLREALGSNAVVWSAQGSRSEMATLYTTDAFIAEHQETADRYLRALVEAERYQQGHGEEAKRILAESLGHDEVDMDRLWSVFEFAIRLDQELLVTMEDQARWNIANGLVEADRPPDYLEYIHFPPLEHANPSAVTIIHGS